MAHQTAEDVGDTLYGMRAAVFWYDHGVGGQSFRKEISSVLDRWLNNGLYVSAACESADIAEVARWLHRLPLVHVVEASGWPSLANDIHAHSPGPIWRDVPVANVDGENLSLSDVAWLQRAFADCTRIEVSRLSGGFSARVYHVHAWLSEGNAVAHPLPFVAKIDARAKVEREVRNYADYVETSIPFRSRPNLVRDRCLMGRVEAILVANFVDESEPFWRSVRKGGGVGAIHSLYAQSLHGWTAQAYEVQDYLDYWTHPRASVARSYLEGGHETVLPARFPHRNQKVAAALGATRDAGALAADISTMRAARHRRGPIHGDLHVENIRVIGSEAILIDFPGVAVGPLVFDSASLEVSVVFGPAVRAEVGRSTADRKRWRAVVDALYAQQNVEGAMPPQCSDTMWQWLWIAIRHLRALALEESEMGETYTQALAMSLLRFASHKGQDAADTFCRGYAYVTGERLLARVAGKGPSAP